MSAGAAAASSGAAAQRHQMMINAVRSFGPVVKIEADGFNTILTRSMETEPNPLIVTASGGWFTTVYSYLTSYKGLYFYTSSSFPLTLPAQAEVIEVDKIWIPNM
jgi:hypothetical protein